MKYLEPKHLTKGDTIGVISLSGIVKSPENITRGVSRLEDLGYNVKLSKHLFDKNRYLAGDDFTKISELHSFFLDPQIDCIICARGGYGAIRIVDDINYKIIKTSPKIFCGYSDITAVSAMMLKHAQLITYSSPMVNGDFGAEDVSEFTIENFIKAVSGESLEFELKGCENKYAEGIVWGGNLTTLASLCGRDFLPDSKFILVVEDVNEPVYKIDRALEQLFGTKKFRDNINGIVFGDFSGVDNLVWLDNLEEEYSKKLNIPYWKGLTIGHNADKITIPLGKYSSVRNNKIVITS